MKEGFEKDGSEMRDQGVGGFFLGARIKRDPFLLPEHPVILGHPLVDIDFLYLP